MTTTAISADPRAPFTQSVCAGIIEPYPGCLPREKEVVNVTAVWDGERLSITANIMRGREWVGGGQSIDAVREARPRDGRQRNDNLRLARLWERWHLNDMRAGCEHQRAFGWGARTIDPEKPGSAYGLHYPGQTSPSWNLAGWVRPEEHPAGLMTRPCPVCGYGYGTAWQREEVPTSALVELREVTR